MLEVGEKALLQRPGVLQFIKFCIVGASSFTIDLGISYLLHFHAGFPLVPAKTISFVLAVTNGFFWNRRWTFDAVGKRDHREQYAMFFAVNIVGYLLNIGIVTAIVGLETKTWINQQPSKPVFLIATLIATCFVVFWKFFANKHWTFKQPE
jgi:putative flippase GtrA